MLLNKSCLNAFYKMTCKHQRNQDKTHIFVMQKKKKTHYLIHIFFDVIDLIKNFFVQLKRELVEEPWARKRTRVGRGKREDLGDGRTINKN